MPLDDASVRLLTGLMGPWFVLDEKIPTAPGVTWPKFLSLIEKGKITPGTIVRGPATGGLWTPAGRAPLVATHLGLCWSCQAPLPPDDALRTCPQCGRALNGPANWPDPQPVSTSGGGAGTAAEADVDAPSAIDELIEVGAAGRGGNGSAPPPRPAGAGRRGRILAVVIATVIAAAVTCAAIALLGAYRPAPPAAPQPDAPGPVGAQPGELFPDVPAGRRIGSARATLRHRRRAAEGRFDEAVRYLQAGNLLAAQDILVSLIETCDTEALPDGAEDLLADIRKRILASRPAGMSEQESAQRKQTAKAQFDRAAALADQGRWMEAQAVLVEMLNGTDRRFWPAGAVEGLDRIRTSIATSPRPADRPDDAELKRQRDSAERLLQHARSLIGKGDILNAQKPLLEILNGHHPAAWPAGTLETFGKVKEALAGAPASRPGFFGIDAAK